jgi:hypothetical protein
LKSKSAIKIDITNRERGSVYGLSSKVKNLNTFNNLISRNNNVEVQVPKKIKAKNILALLEQRSDAHRERES